MTSVDSPLKKFGQIGIASKGVVYVLAGALTVSAALGIGGGDMSGKKDSLSFVYEQPFGQVLLFAIGIGLLGYTVFRLITAYKYDKPDKSAWFNWGKKIAYAASGLFYVSIAYSAIKMALTSASSGGSGSGQKQSIVSSLLGSTIGQVVLFAAAGIIAGRACFQFYQAWSGKFTKRINEAKLDYKAKKALRYAGIFGYVSRGVVILLVAYMLINAVLTNDPSEAKGMQESFQLLHSNFGPYALAIIAAGLVSYGSFMIVKAYLCYLPELE